MQRHGPELAAVVALVVYVIGSRRQWILVLAFIVGIALLLAA